MIASALARLFQPKNWGDVRPDDPARYMRYLPVPQLPPNLQFTMDTALQFSAVWACVDCISKAISASHWAIYTNDGNGNKTFLPNDQLVWVLNTRPNPEMTGIGWRECLMYAALTWGNGYAEIVKDRAGRVKELWPLLPERMTPRRRPDKKASLYYDYYSLDGNHYILEPDQVFHLRGPSITGLLGENVVSRAAKSIALGIASERFALSYYGNNTVVGEILEYPGKLEPSAHARLKEEWEEKRQGADKAHKPIILEGGMKLTNINHDAEKSQIVNARTFQLEEICRWFGVPPHKVQHLIRATFNNIEHLELEFVRDALTPWAKRIEQEADYKLFPQKSSPTRYTKINMAWLSQGDNESRAKAAVGWRQAGVKTANEIRHEEDLNAIEGAGDVLLVGSGMQTLDNLINPPDQQQALTGKPDKPATPAKEGDEHKSPEEEGSEEQGDLDPQDLVREAVVMLFASAIDRYTRRLMNRQTDLQRRALPASQIEQNLASERTKLRPWLLGECSQALKLVKQMTGRSPLDENGILLAADSVDNGMPPHEAAVRLVEQFFAAD